MSVEPPVDTPPVRFEVLGPVRAWCADAELELGPGKQRAVLAVLLLDANRPTPTTKIIDAVWGDDPPENGVNVVQKYVAGLRRALEPGRAPRAPGQILTLTDAGYAPRVESGCLDTDVFANRVEEARAARSAGRAVGGFTSVRDLATEGLLPASVVHAMGDILIVLGEVPPEARQMRAVRQDGRAGEA